MARKADPGFEVYKGLQKPLVFKSLKGKYIYWGLGCVAGGFLLAVILSLVINFFTGLLALAGITFGGLGYIAWQQKKGLHHKTRAKGAYLVPVQWQSGPLKESSTH